MMLPHTSIVSGPASPFPARVGRCSGKSGAGGRVAAGIGGDDSVLYRDSKTVHCTQAAGISHFVFASASSTAATTSATSRCFSSSSQAVHAQLQLICIGRLPVVPAGHSETDS